MLKSREKKDKTRIIILIGILFLYNDFKLIGEEENKSHILSTLFNMIIIISIMQLLLHKEELNKKGFLKKKFLEEYFSFK